MKNQGKIIPDSILRVVKLSYYESGIKKYVNDLQTVLATNYANMGLMSTRDIGAYGTKTYQIEYQNSISSDTLFVDYSSATPATGCTEMLRQIKFNNQIPPIDTSFKFDSPVYIFNK